MAHAAFFLPSGAAATPVWLMGVEVTSEEVDPGSALLVVGGDSVPEAEGGGGAGCRGGDCDLSVIVSTEAIRCMLRYL